jgi:putative SOS response-associated peptidase YedK
MTLDMPINTIIDIYGIVRKIERDLNPRYNVTPSQDIPIVRQDAEGVRELAYARWGLIPPWANDMSIGYKLINARAETVREKPSYRSAFKCRRCVIPAGGFYEWQATDGPRKKPWLFRVADGSPMSLASLWEHWEGPDGQVVESCSILTTIANGLMAPIHDRMPVVLPGRDDVGVWLDVGSSLEDVSGLLLPCASEALVKHTVSDYVNAPAHTGPECVVPVTE